MTINAWRHRRGVVIVRGAPAALEYETWTAIAGSTIWCKFFSTSH
jgi:hypothetical protein